MGLTCNQNNQLNSNIKAQRNSQAKHFPKNKTQQGESLCWMNEYIFHVIILIDRPQVYHNTMKIRIQICLSLQIFFV